MALDIDTPIGRIAADHPSATRVFARHRLDYCCGGDQPLRAVCEASSLDTEAVMREIEHEVDLASGNGSSSIDGWTETATAELIDHIIAAYHEPLREELPRLASMARKVAAVHGARHPVTLPALADAVVSLGWELERHMSDEESVVFPMILANEDTGAAPLTDLEHDHEEAGAALERIRRLADDYAVPAEACSTWRALWSGLEDLERTTHEHVHLENNVLFPRVLAG